MTRRDVLVTGGTGYLGKRLVATLVERGHRVRALVRATSASRVPAGAEAVVGDALDATSFSSAVSPSDTLVHLVGTPHPSPSRAAEFERVDFASIVASTKAVQGTTVRHFIYVSVAQPAPVMRAYVDVRSRGEALVRSNGIPATVLRPWYVLGPGHRWAYALIPAYWLLKRLPFTTATATRLDLVTLAAMVRSLRRAVEEPCADGVRTWDVRSIREEARRPDAR